MFYLVQQNAESRIEARIKTLKDDDKGLFVIKIPLNLPYQTNWKEFESIDGEANFNGRIYKYVKRKVFNDTLILVCLDFKEKASIQKSSNDYFKKVNDLANDTGKKSTLKILKIDDFYQPQKNDLKKPNVLESQQQYGRSGFGKFSGYLNTIFIPPDKLA